jgi:hypothetical protein
VLKPAVLSASHAGLPVPTLLSLVADDVVEEKAFGTAIMGVMYTVCKEKNRYSWFFIGARLLADWLQL